MFWKDTHFMSFHSSNSLTAFWVVSLSSFLSRIPSIVRFVSWLLFSLNLVKPFTKDMRTLLVTREVLGVWLVIVRDLRHGSKDMVFVR